MSAVLLAVVIVVASCDRAPAASGAKAPESMVLPGDVSGAWWDAASRSLYLTDDTHHSIIRWTGTDFETVARVDGANGLGGLARLADGRFVVTAFGGGTAGGVFVIDGANASAVPGLDPARRRTGVAVAPDGAIYVTFFTKARGAEARGGIAELDLVKGETDVITTDLQKPVGIAATSLALFVTDQQRARLVSYARTDLAHSAAVVTSEIAEPDLMTILPGGDLVIGSKTGAVYRVTPAGGPHIIARDLGQIRGVAYDSTGRRLFVIDHGGARRPSRLIVLAVE